MRHFLRIFLPAALSCCLLLCSCEGSKADPEFITTTDCNLRVNGNVVFTFDPLTCQVAFNREKCEFRANTDNMSDYYCVTLRSVPTAEDQKVKGSITWTSKSDLVTRKDLSFVVKKVDRAGRMWLWCRKERIGVVIQALD